jgi:hypothetical protein
MLPYLMPLTLPPIPIVVFQTERAIGLPDWWDAASRSPGSYPRATSIEAEAAMAAPFWLNYPKQLQIGSPDPAVYELKADYYALTYDPDAAPPAQAIATIDGIAIFAGEPIDPSAATAVYGLSGQAMAVPTGQVFVRFSSGNAADRQGAIAAAGYQIAETLDYAPEAAWLRASSGNIADALTQLAALQGLDNIAAIEPQLVMARSLR